MKNLITFSTFSLLIFLANENLLGQMRDPTSAGNSYVADGEVEKQVVFLTYDGQYDEALQISEKMMDKVPVSIQWKFLHAMILWRKMRILGWATGSIDGRLVNRVGDELFALKRMVDDGPDSLRSTPRHLFYAGAIYGYLGMYYDGILGQHLKAIGVGKDALDYHKRVLGLDSACYDAYYSLGVYNFVASGLPWYVKPLLLVFGLTGSEELADAYLTLASRRGNLSKYEAGEMLTELYVRRGMLDSAVALCRKLIQEFPDNNYYYLNLGRICKSFQRVDEMAKVYQEAIEHSRKKEPTEGNVDCLINIYLLLGSHYSKTNRVGDAISLYEDGLTRSFAHHDWWCYRIGICYEKLNDKKSAIQYYKLVTGNDLTKEENMDVQARLNQLLNDVKQ